MECGLAHTSRNFSNTVSSTLGHSELESSQCRTLEIVSCSYMSNDPSLAAPSSMSSLETMARSVVVLYAHLELVD